MINSLDQSAVTQALKTFLSERADLSTDSSGNIGVVPVGVGIAPPPPDGQQATTAVDLALGTMDSYLVIYPVPLGPRADRGTYNGGGPSSTVFRYQIAGVSLEQLAAERLATVAAARICDVHPVSGGYLADIDIPGHYLSHRERAFNGPLQRVGELFQAVELIDLDVSIDLVS